ncbi:MAG: dCMP deaminase family protein [Chloroflexi bacterium]|nr:dCMP deaminase family protein [Chloroflexota bacterium]
MGIALAVRARANCLGSRVGAVIVMDRRIVSTGYNGTPAGMPNCDEGGCDRCGNRARYPAGTGYDVCICVHAEQNALLAAARFGIAVAGASIYTTSRPCFGCLKELLQAGMSGVHFLHEWTPHDSALKPEYDRLLAGFKTGVQRVEVDDPDREWAISTLRTGEVQGHASPGL